MTQNKQQPQKRQDKTTQAAYEYINARGKERNLYTIADKYLVDPQALDTRIFQLQTLRGWGNW